MGVLSSRPLLPSPVGLEGLSVHVGPPGGRSMGAMNQLRGGSPSMVHVGLYDPVTTAHLCVCVWVCVR